MASTIPNMIWTHWKFVPRRQPNLKIDEKRWIVDVVIHFFSLTQNYACRHRQTKQLSWLGWLAGERYSSWEIKLRLSCSALTQRSVLEEIKTRKKFHERTLSLIAICNPCLIVKMVFQASSKLEYFCLLRPGQTFVEIDNYKERISQSLHVYSSLHGY